MRWGFGAKLPRTQSGFAGRNGITPSLALPRKYRRRGRACAASFCEGSEKMGASKFAVGTTHSTRLPSSSAVYSSPLPRSFMPAGRISRAMIPFFWMPRRNPPRRMPPRPPPPLTATSLAIGAERASACRMPESPLAQLSLWKDSAISKAASTPLMSSGRRRLI